MKNWSLTVVVLLISLIGFAQQGKVYPKYNRIKIGAVNTFVYESPKNIEIPENSWVSVLPDTFGIITTPLTKVNDNYEFSLFVDPNDTLCLITIIDKNQTPIDSNNKKGYTLLINKNAENPVLCELEIRSRAYSINGIEIDPPTLLTQFEKLYSKKPHLKEEVSYCNYLFMKGLSNEEMAVTAEELIQKGTEKSITTAIRLYFNRDMIDKEEKTKKLLIEKHPLAEEAKQYYINEWNKSSIKTEESILKDKEEFISKFNDSSEKYISQFDQQLITAYLNNRDYHKLVLLEKTFNHKTMFAHICNNYAWSLSGQDLLHPGTDLDFAEKVSKLTVDIIEKGINTPSHNQDQLSLPRIYNMFADTYALILYKLKRYDEAFRYQDTIAQKDELDTGEKERYAGISEKAKGVKFTIEFIEKELSRATNSRLLLQQLERLYKEL